MIDILIIRKVTMAKRHEQLEKTFNLPSLSELTDEEIEQVDDDDIDDEVEETYDELQKKIKDMSKKISEYDNMSNISSSVTKKYNEDIDELHNLAKNGYQEIFNAALTMDPTHGSKYLNGAAKLLEIAVRSKNSSMEKQIDMAKLQLEREKMLRNNNRAIKDLSDIDEEDATDYGTGENGGRVYDRNEIIRNMQNNSRTEENKGDDPC